MLLSCRSGLLLLMGLGVGVVGSVSVPLQTSKQLKISHKTILAVSSCCSCDSKHRKLILCLSNLIYVLIIVDTTNKSEYMRYMIMYHGHMIGIP